MWREEQQKSLSIIKRSLFSPIWINDPKYLQYNPRGQYYYCSIDQKAYYDDYEYNYGYWIMIEPWKDHEILVHQGLEVQVTWA